MGPGSFDPGSPLSQVPDREHHEASMGPGSFDPGSGFPRRQQNLLGQASMGPGSFDPGSYCFPTAISRLLFASMGPGSFDPGSGTPTDGEWTTNPRFNGAGVFRPRKYDAACLVVTAWCCFNGAGVFRPRKFAPEVEAPGEVIRFNGAGVFRPRKLHIAYGTFLASLWLQWGRGLSTPEVASASVAGKPGQPASMGPGSFDPGSSA